MTRMFITRMFFILLAFGSATSSLTLTARVARSVPRQAEAQGGEDTKESSSAAEVKETGWKKKPPPIRIRNPRRPHRGAKEKEEKREV